MTRQEEQINAFLVNVFNDVLRLEEENLRCLGGKRLSVSEMHVLEAVQQQGEADVTMRQLAAGLGVTASTLTIAVKTLERKGYLVRLRPLPDKRRGGGTADRARAAGAGSPRPVPRSAGASGKHPADRPGTGRFVPGAGPAARLLYRAFRRNRAVRPGTSKLTRARGPARTKRNLRGERDL